jgi:hypothetical protein
MPSGAKNKWRRGGRSPSEFRKNKKFGKICVMFVGFFLTARNTPLDTNMFTQATRWLDSSDPQQSVVRNFNTKFERNVLENAVDRGKPECSLRRTIMKMDIGGGNEREGGKNMSDS